MHLVVRLLRGFNFEGDQNTKYTPPPGRPKRTPPLGRRWPETIYHITPNPTEHKDFPARISDLHRIKQRGGHRRESIFQIVGVKLDSGSWKCLDSLCLYLVLCCLCVVVFGTPFLLSEVILIWSYNLYIISAWELPVYVIKCGLVSL